MARDFRIIINKSSLEPAKKLNKDKLVTFRVEPGLYESFQALCEEKLEAPVSQVLRQVMIKLCDEFGYLKK